MRKLYTTITLCILCAFGAVAATPILGTNEATVDQLYNFVKAQNSSFDREIAEQFIAVSAKYGLRGDIALCQSIVETGWFKYTGGTAVTPDDHNYCGLGVTTLGQKGCQFSTVKDGVTAQIQHLYAYACNKAIPEGETLIDPRFNYVTRGCAPNWEDLGGKWAAASDYGTKILNLYVQMTGSLPTTTPSLKASKTDITLSATCGGTSRGTTVKITGSNLSSKIIYNSSSSVFKVTPASTWDDYTGGNLTISLDTSRDAGTYTGYIAVQSGSGSTLQRIEINCTGTLKSNSSTTDPGTTTNSSTPTALPEQFSTDWCYSAVNGTSVSWMNPANEYTRNMVLNNGKLYVVQRDPDNSTGNIQIINANTGVANGTLSKSGLSGDAYIFASVANMGGTIVACNLAYSSTTALKVYSWSSDSATPSIMLETTNHGGRAGDLMSASGTINNGKLYFASNDQSGKIYVYTVTNGVASTTPQIVTLKNASGSAFDMGGTFAVVEIKANEDGTFWATGKAGVPTLYNADGTIASQLSGTAVDNNVNGSSFCMFNYGNFKLAAATSYVTGVQQGYLNLIDVTNGVASAVKLKSFDTLGKSGVSNGTIVTTALAQVEGTKIHLLVLIPKQGVAKYTASSTASGVETLVAENDAQIQVCGKQVIASENVTSISLVAMTGQVAAQCNGSELNADNVANGIYIVVATLNNGTHVTKKVILK